MLFIAPKEVFPKGKKHQITPNYQQVT